MSEPTFKHTEEQEMFMENSFGMVTPPTTVTMTTNVWLWKHGWTGNKNRGNFEWVGGDFYAEGDCGLTTTRYWLTTTAYLTCRLPASNSCTRTDTYASETSRCGASRAVLSSRRTSE